MKSFLIYLILVGIPVVGVIGVLRAGRHITPAPYVGGTWKVTVSPDSLCPSATAGDTVVLTVSQSGPHITATLKTPQEIKLSGRAYGAQFRVSGSDQVQLHAAVKRGENRMRGILVGYPCAAARRTLLRGNRVLPPNQTETH
jgi:hypothetical protein